MEQRETLRHWRPTRFTKGEKNIELNNNSSEFWRFFHIFNENTYRGVKGGSWWGAMEFSWEMIWLNHTSRFGVYLELFGSQFTTSCSGLCCAHYGTTRPTCYLAGYETILEKLFREITKWDKFDEKEMRKRRNQNQRNNPFNWCWSLEQHYSRRRI